jgi:hypothetical protein
VLDIFESLSLPASALIVAVTAAAIVACLTMTRLYVLRWLLAFLVPFALAYTLYWAPVWRGASSAEYSAWAFLVISVWFISGAVACLIVVGLIGTGDAPFVSTSKVSFA